jgi:hypothetical protein
VVYYHIVVILILHYTILIRFFPRKETCYSYSTIAHFVTKIERQGRPVL